MFYNGKISQTFLPSLVSLLRHLCLLHNKVGIGFVSQILHREGENKDGLQNDVKSVHAAQTASRIPKSSSDSLTDTKKKKEGKNQ